MSTSFFSFCSSRGVAGFRAVAKISPPQAPSDHDLAGPELLRAPSIRREYRRGISSSVSVTTRRSRVLRITGVKNEFAQSPQPHPGFQSGKPLGWFYCEGETSCPCDLPATNHSRRYAPRPFHARRLRNPTSQIAAIRSNVRKRANMFESENSRNWLTKNHLAAFLANFVRVSGIREFFEHSPFRASFSRARASRGHGLPCLREVCQGAPMGRGSNPHGPDVQAAYRDFPGTAGPRKPALRHQRQGA